MGIAVKMEATCDFYGCNNHYECDTDNEDYFRVKLMELGWLYLPRCENYVCPQCVKKNGGKELLLQKDENGEEF